MELSKGNVMPECPNAGNPFHECTDRCFERITFGDVPRKERKLFGFGKKSAGNNTPPGSPARVIAGNRSPRPSYYAKKKVESDGSPSYSSSEDNHGGDFFNRPKNLSRYDQDPHSMSPSRPDRHTTTSRFDRRRAEHQSHLVTEASMSPVRAPISRPRTPEHRPSTPDTRPTTFGTQARTPERRPRSRTPEARPRTPDHQYASIETRPRTPESRPRTPDHQYGAIETRPRTPETRPRTPDHQYGAMETRPRTPDHQYGAVETRPRTPETRPRTPDHLHRTLETRPRTPDHYYGAVETRPRTPETRPRTPDHQYGTIEARPGTPDHQYGTLDARPRTPETRRRATEHRARSPGYRARSPGPRSRTPEPQVRYLEPRARTPEPRAKTPEPGSRNLQNQPTFFDVVGRRAPQSYKAESVYTEDDDESVMLHPELLYSPQERPASRPITPKYGTPTRQEEEFDQMAESESSDDNFSFIDDHDDGSVYLYPELVSSDAKPRSGSSTPVHHKLRTSYDEQEEEILKHSEPPELPDEMLSFTLSEIARMKGLEHYETQSMMSESYVSVSNYKVRASVAATLQHILEKHGDIGSDSRLQSMSTRSYYLEMLAGAVMELQSTPLRGLKETRVAEMLALVKDMESVKIQVNWLRSLLEEIHEAAKHYDRHEATGVEKEGCDRDLMIAKQEMEVRMKELVKKEKETKECREKVTEIGGRLGSLEMKQARLDKRLAFLSGKVNKFQGKYVMEDII